MPCYLGSLTMLTSKKTWSDHMTLLSSASSVFVPCLADVHVLCFSLALLLGVLPYGFLHDILFSTTPHDFSYYTMGFFQRFLSFGSRRNKKRRAALSTETRSKHPLSREDARRQQQEQEENANRILRSSSLRYAVVNEVDYSSLPPIREYRLVMNKITPNPS